MLNEVADGVWVRQSEWVWSNAVVVRGHDGAVVVDPGIDGSDLSKLADDVDRLGLPVVAGFSTHPHWDPLLDPRQSGQVDAYEAALDRLGEAAGCVNVVVPGHGAVAEGPEVAARLAADRAYIDALRRGDDPVDARLDQDWLSGPHQSNVVLARASDG
jgi:glyoxylase-like metal-dependent hydrolase (beta-lactamase superfamily II)